MQQSDQSTDDEVFVMASKLIVTWQEYGPAGKNQPELVTRRAWLFEVDQFGNATVRQDAALADSNTQPELTGTYRVLQAGSWRLEVQPS